MLELLIVVMILGILGMAILPQIQSLIRETELNGAAGELVTALEYAADLAATFERPFGVKAAGGSTVFSVYDARYEIDPAAHTNATPPVTAFGVVVNPVDKQWYAIDLRNQAYYGSVLISNAPPAGKVLFYPAGNCSTLSNSFVVCLGGNIRTITLNGANGKITVQ